MLQHVVRGKEIAPRSNRRESESVSSARNAIRCKQKKPINVCTRDDKAKEWKDFHPRGPYQSPASSPAFAPQVQGNPICLLFKRHTDAFVICFWWALQIPSKA